PSRPKNHTLNLGKLHPCNSIDVQHTLRTLNPWPLVVLMQNHITPPNPLYSQTLNPIISLNDHVSIPPLPHQKKTSSSLQVESYPLRSHNGFEITRLKE